MNVVLGGIFLTAAVVFFVMTAGEKGSWKQKGIRWIRRWSRKKGWELPEWVTAACVLQVEAAVLAAGVLLLASGFTGGMTGSREISQLKRPGYGEGIQEEKLQVEWKNTEGGKQKEEVTVEVSEKQFSREEITEIFSKIRGVIEKEMLGENLSVNRIEHPLSLMEKLADWPVSIRWFSDRPEILDWEGCVGDGIAQEGERVILTATIELQEEETTESWELLVFPEVRDEKKQVEEMVEKANADPADGSEWMQLPAAVNGERLIWKKAGEGASYGAALLALALPTMVLLHRQQQEKERKKREQQQMQQDYPEIVTKLQLLLSTGMNLRKSVERIADDYIAYMRGEEVRAAYEILVEICREMERGLGEKEAYEALGERWGMLCYRTLAALLVQCLQKGSSGVEQVLEKEAGQARRLRRQQAQILGEQASTRLLFPMILMLLVVFVILLVPAWLTFAA